MAKRGSDGGGGGGGGVFAASKFWQGIRLSSTVRLGYRYLLLTLHA